MEQIHFYKTTEPDGDVRTLRGLARPYQALTKVFEYFALVSPDQEEWVVPILAGGVHYLDEHGNTYPDGRKYYPSYACVNYRDPNKTLWISHSSLLALLQADNNLVLVEEDSL